MIMNKGRLQKTVKMTVGLIITLCVINCTSDDFWGIQEEYDGIEYPILEKIAKSNEFIEYQKQIYLHMEEINNLDTDKTNKEGNVDNKPMSGVSISFGNVLDARRQLIMVYPEYEEATDYEKNQILNLALLNDKSLLAMAKKCMPNNQYLTKSLCRGTDAFIYVHSGTPIEYLSSEDGGEWLVLNKYHWYARVSWYDALFLAISSTEESGLERGGYVFRDNSGLMTIDPDATNTEYYSEMSFVWWDLSEGNEYQPIRDFHIHPSTNNVIPSDSDRATWSRMPWNEHWIYDLGGHSEKY